MRKEWLFLAPAALITMALGALVLPIAQILILHSAAAPEWEGSFAIYCFVSGILTFVGIDTVCKVHDGATAANKTTGIAINQETKSEETK